MKRLSTIFLGFSLLCAVPAFAAETAAPAPAPTCNCDKDCQKDCAHGKGSPKCNCDCGCKEGKQCTHDQCE